MKERIMLGVIVVLALAGIAASTFIWLAYRQGQEFNQAMLAQMMEMMGRSDAESVPADWVSLQVKLVEEHENGQPVPGATIELGGYAFSDAVSTEVNSETDERGLAQFGPIRPGRYSIISINTPSGYGTGHRRVTLYPGRDGKHTVICPKEVSMPKATVRLNIEWPEDLDTESLAAFCEFRALPFEASGAQWRAPDPSVLVLGTESVVKPDSYFGEPRTSGSIRIITTDTTDEISWNVASYQLLSIFIYSNQESHRWEARGTRRGREARAARRARAPGDVPYDPEHYFLVASERHVEASPVFRVEPGQVNTITIKPPPALVDELREALSEAEAET